MGRIKDFTRKIKEHIAENLFILGSFKFKKNIRATLNKQKSEFKNLAVFSDNKKRYLLRSNKENRQLCLVDLDNKRSSKKLLLSNKKAFLLNPRGRNFVFSRISNQEYYISYQTTYKKKIKTNFFFSSDLKIWERSVVDERIVEKSIVSSSFSVKQKKLIFSGNKKHISLSFFDDIKKIGTYYILIKVRKEFFDEERITLIAVFNNKEGILLFYVAFDRENKLGLGAVLLEKNNLKKVLWRTELPLWKSVDERVFSPLGITRYKGQYTFFAEDGDGNLSATDLSAMIFSKTEEVQSEIKMYPALERIATNPVLLPNGKNKWESSAVFNPAALYVDGRVHLIYRAIGQDGMSVLGYSSSEDGINFNERLSRPAYFPKEHFEFVGKNVPDRKIFSYPYMSGGGWGGCEDPRISLVGDRVYMTYVAFNGQSPPGVALTSIKLKNFLKKHWDWEKPRLISPPGEIQKNWVVFPEKVNGKYAVLHSITPSIKIDYFDSLDDDKIRIKSFHDRRSDSRRWDNIMRGVGAPPIKTDKGWLVLYHAMDKRDPNRYKVGVMILDYKNPEKILHRCLQPVLQPDACYENNGYKAGVVYVCGAVIKDKKLYVYYGGADSVVCVAVASLDELLSSLTESPKLVFMKRVLLN